MKNLIDYSQFYNVDIRLGTIIEATINSSLKKPAIILKINFGDKIGIKKSSAQITNNYNISSLINKQVIAVVNFQPKQIGNIMSEVLVLGLPDINNDPVLLSPDIKLKNGVKLY